MILIFLSSILFIIWLGDFMTRADIFLSIKICFSRHQELLYLPLEDLLHQQVPVHCLLVHVWVCLCPQQHWARHITTNIS